MFHTPNIGLTRLQAEAAGIPLVVQETDGLEGRNCQSHGAPYGEEPVKYGLEGQ